MNERMIQLALQAEDYAFDEIKKLESSVEPVISNRVFFKSFKEKFAELIVNQMLEITDAHTEVFQTDRDRALIEHIKQSLKQHFGVEE